ncbi:MAG TPA: polysaccharide biosynthesis tyrosine autokinase [Dictyobacter sp.]|jgi:capsular exopolysaccharide synthesis family protein|nr:polysaccharide biosynthesis tyrosine autokinase [Dictyobacter sp.]
MRSFTSRYIIRLQQSLWLIIASGLLCGSLAFTTAACIHPVYRATTIVITKIDIEPPANTDIQAVLSLQPILSHLLTTTIILEPVATEHHLTIDQLKKRIHIHSDPTSPMIEISVDNTNPSLAALLANEMANKLTGYVTTQIVNAAPIDIIPASQPTIPLYPHPRRATLLGTLIGLIGIILMIGFTACFDHRFVLPEDIKHALNLDILAIIPRLNRKQRRQSAEDIPELAEKCRILCTYLNTIPDSQPGKLIMVTSALIGEGKSTVAVNLATFLALSGKQVLLVDTDLRHPALDQHYHIDNTIGLANTYFEGIPRIETILDGQTTDLFSLRILTSGILPTNPAELLQSQQTSRLFQYYKHSNKFDYIIFDTPPVLPVADAQILASYIPYTIIVVDLAKTTQWELQQTQHLLLRAGTNIVGVTVNKSVHQSNRKIQTYLRETSYRIHPPTTHLITEHRP